MTSIHRQRLPPPEEFLRSFAPPGWELVRVGVNEYGHLAMYLAATGSDVSFRLRLSPHGSLVRPMMVNPVGDVRIDDLHGISHDAARAVGTTVFRNTRGFLLPLLALFPHLLLDQNQDDANALRSRIARILATRPPWLGQTHQDVPAIREDLFFDPPGIVEWLAPQVAIGELFVDHKLTAIELPPNPLRTSLDLRLCVLTFSHIEDNHIVRVQVGARDAVARPFARMGPMALGLHDYTFRHLEDDVPVPTASLCAWLAVVMAMKLGPARSIRVPRRVHEVRAIAVPAAATSISADIDAAGTLHLHLDAECGQTCVFCPIKAVVPPQDEGEVELEGHRWRLRAARAHGSRHVQLNGLDPLAFSRILDLVDSVVEQGFERLTFMGPARRLANEDFRRALLSRAPAQTNIVVPLYGVTAQVHDAVTGRQGSYDEVLAALDGLLTDADPTRIALATVITKQNAHEWTALVAFANARNLPLFSQPVYPLRAHADETYRNAALPETMVVPEVVRTLHVLHPEKRSAALASLATVVRHPCIRYHAEQRSGERVYSAGAQEQAIALAAVIRKETGSSEAEGKLGATTISCPQSAQCALASACPREHYTAYVELFGTNEFVAVPGTERAEDIN